MKQKTINARIVEKTTAEFYYYFHFSLYSGFYESSYLSFYGTREAELTKALNEFIKEKETPTIYFLAYD